MTTFSVTWPLTRSVSSTAKSNKTHENLSRLKNNNSPRELKEVSFKLFLDMVSSPPEDKCFGWKCVFSCSDCQLGHTWSIIFIPSRISEATSEQKTA